MIRFAHPQPLRQKISVSGIRQSVASKTTIVLGCSREIFEQIAG